MKAIKHLLYFSIFILCLNSYCQVDKNDPLYKTIIIKDSLLFSEGFNKCNMIPFKELIAEDFEFYHDKSGITQSKSKFISDLKNGLCSNPENYTSNRRLIKNSTEIYPLYNNGELYGAIHNGSHTFFESNNKQAFVERSTARFTSLWLFENNTWLLKRILSFDHVLPEDK
ncbi:DUF4440 domain-containing protein [Patiriisocius hiemis]|uniref:DUF4440 domain-containing protein n=1 Tax=Patiriisocius hiemis TaxID=3075604 RepID=A0ABU2YFB3_9FLAO|nr:DUF4440 domain-containing protein [Constantimarinum sp. W242]MDT0556571.1 DUF4440 domain-containing protein [Constantimarinum sp. W242]